VAAKLGPGDPAQTRAALSPLIERATRALEIELDGAARSAIEVWLARLLEWNARIDLTAARSLPELVDLMLADALVLARHLSPQARIVDVGTGAGAPGLALALLRPDLRMTLVEPLGKRASFLRTAIGEARRADIGLERVRGEALAGRRAWDAAISRATLAPDTWLGLGATLAAPGGSVWVLLAKDAAPTHPRARAEADVAYVWPLTGAERRAVHYRID
jgi:16S rRNA (guanine527-N7)-methyltransferase